MKPYSPIPRFANGTTHSQLIRRVLRPDLDASVQRVDLITTTTFRLSLFDSGSRPVAHTAEGETTIHVLWQKDEVSANITISGERFPIAPGDSVAIPMGDSWQCSPDQLVIIVSRRSSSLVMPLAPTHGPDRFVGHNRETVPPGMGLARWKLTEPLSLADIGNDRILVGLYADLAIQYDGGVSMLRQGEASVIRAGTGRITLVPNGLTYVLVVD